MVIYNLNLDDLLPAFNDWGLFEALVERVPGIRVTIFVPTNSRDWGDDRNDITLYPEWCRALADLPAGNFEVAYHGHYHHKPDHSPEFAELSMAEAVRRLALSRNKFSLSGIKVTKGFRPPRWAMSVGTREALEAMNFRYLADSPDHHEEHREITIPRIYSNCDLVHGFHWSLALPYRHLIPDPRWAVIQRGHVVSRVDNNLTWRTLDNVVRTVEGLEDCRFMFLGEIGDAIGRAGIAGCVRAS